MSANTIVASSSNARPAYTPHPDPDNGVAGLDDDACLVPNEGSWTDEHNITPLPPKEWLSKWEADKREWEATRSQLQAYASRASKSRPTNEHPARQLASNQSPTRSCTAEDEEAVSPSLVEQEKDGIPAEQAKDGWRRRFWASITSSGRENEKAVR